MGAAARDCTPSDTPASEPSGSWWDRHKDAVLYPAVFAVVVSLGLVWNGALSLVLTPLWMLVGVWLVPSAIERAIRRGRGPR
jgi:hypothetical protein